MLDCGCILFEFERVFEGFLQNIHWEADRHVNWISIDIFVKKLHVFALRICNLNIMSIAKLNRQQQSQQFARAWKNKTKQSFQLHYSMERFVFRVLCWLLKAIPNKSLFLVLKVYVSTKLVSRYNMVRRKLRKVYK